MSRLREATDSRLTGLGRKLRKLLLSRAALRALGLALFAWILAKVSLSSVMGQIASSEATYLVLTLLLLAPMMMLKAWRWKYLLGMQSISYSLGSCLRANLAGVYVGCVTPGRAGDFVKTLYLRSDARIPLGKAFSSVLVDSLLDLWLVALIAFVGALWLFGPREIVPLIAALLAGLTLLPWLLGRGKVFSFVLALCAARLPWNSAVEKFKASSFLEGLMQLRPGGLLVPVALTGAAYLVAFGQSYLVASALRLNLPFLFVVVAVCVSRLVVLVPISISGLGTREAALIGLFATRGLSSEAAVSFSVLSLVIQQLPLAFWGLAVWTARPPLDKRAVSLLMDGGEQGPYAGQESKPWS